MNPPAAPASPVNWPRRLLWIGIGLLALVVIVLIASAVVPREWAQTIGGQANGGLLSGSGLGLFYGFVFTLLPLMVLGVAVRFRASLRLWIAAVVVALVLAAPNLMTLSIVVGNGNAAHAGERIMDVEAPGFRGGSLVGGIVAAAAFGFVAYTIMSRRRAKRRADRLEGDLRRATDERDGATK